MTDYELFIMAVHMFGIKHSTFRAALDFDTYIAFHDCNDHLTHAFWFDSVSGNMLQQVHYVPRVA